MMTEEDQKLVTHAALLGVRFFRTPRGGWASSEYPEANPGTYTVGRAAAWALFHLNLMTRVELEQYLESTLEATNCRYHDVDSSFVQAPVSQ